MKIVSLLRRRLAPSAHTPVEIDKLSPAQQAHFNYTLMHSAALERERRAIDQQ